MRLRQRVALHPQHVAHARLVRVTLDRLCQGLPVTGFALAQAILAVVQRAHLQAGSVRLQRVMARRRRGRHFQEFFMVPALP
ncbi:hypothetical protein RLIN73S_07295 [Rhodanobacter lindaniclasticus]